MAKRKPKDNLQAYLYKEFERLAIEEEMQNDFEQLYKKETAKRKTSRNTKKVRRRPKKTTSKTRGSTKRKTQGYGKRLTVQKATHFRGKPWISTFKITTFKRGTRVHPSTSVSSIVRKLKPYVLKQYKTLGKAHNDLYYLRIYYNHKWDKTTEIQSAFSTTVAKIKSENQIMQYLQDIAEAFISSLQVYSKNGANSFILKGAEIRIWNKP